MEAIDYVVLEVSAEVKRAMKLHKPMASVHEAYSVLLEEVDEFWDEVKKRHESRDGAAMKKELLQIAAMACRAIHDLKL